MNPPNSQSRTTVLLSSRIDDSYGDEDELTGYFDFNPDDEASTESPKEKTHFSILSILKAIILFPIKYLTLLINKLFFQANPTIIPKDSYSFSKSSPLPSPLTQSKTHIRRKTLSNE